MPFCVLSNISKAADEKHLKLSHPTPATSSGSFQSGISPAGGPGLASWCCQQRMQPGRLRTAETHPLPVLKAKGLGVGRAALPGRGRREGLLPAPALPSLASFSQLPHP